MEVSTAVGLDEELVVGMVVSTAVGEELVVGVFDEHDTGGDTHSSPNK